MGIQAPTSSFFNLFMTFSGRNTLSTRKTFTKDWPSWLLSVLLWTTESKVNIRTACLQWRNCLELSILGKLTKPPSFITSLSYHWKIIRLNVNARTNLHRCDIDTAHLTARRSSHTHTRPRKTTDSGANTKQSEDGTSTQLVCRRDFWYNDQCSLHYVYIKLRNNIYPDGIKSISESTLNVLSCNLVRLIWMNCWNYWKWRLRAI